MNKLIKCRWFICLLLVLGACHCIVAQEHRKVAQAMSDSVAIIALGDPTHLEGTITSERIALIKELHETKEFTIVAFESNLFEMYYGYRQFLEDGNTAHVYEGMYGIFPCKELEPLLQWAKSCQETQNKVLLIGVESKFTGVNTLANLQDFLKKEIENIDAVLRGKEEEYYKALSSLIHKSMYMRKMKEAERDLIKQYTTMLLEEVNKQKHRGFVTDVLKQTLQNMITEANRLTIKSVLVRDNERDVAMEKNAQFLHRFGKMILWGSSTHYLNKPEAIYKRYFQKQQRVTMGQLLKRHFGADYFFIAYSSLAGNKTNLIYKSKIRSPKSGTLEYKALNLKQEEDTGCFMSLNKRNSYHLYTQKEIIPCRILGHAYAKMKVSAVCDAVYFIDKTQPYTKF